MTTTAEIVKAALALPEAERLAIAKQLSDSVVPPGVMCEGDPGFFEELDRRMHAMDSGEDPGIDGAEAIEKLRMKRQMESEA